MVASKTHCVRCGRVIGGRHNRVIHGICEQCFDAMSPAEKSAVNPEWTLRHEDAEQKIIDGHALTCPVCGHEKFWTRKTVLLTPAAAFMNFNWGSKAAINYICDQCGYIYWFLREPNK